MSNKNLTVRLAVLISLEANERIRSRARGKGDLSKLADEAFMGWFDPENQAILAKFKSEKLAYGPKVEAQTPEPLGSLGDTAIR